MPQCTSLHGLKQLRNGACSVASVVLSQPGLQSSGYSAAPFLVYVLAFPEFRFSFQVKEYLAEEAEDHLWALLMFSGDRAQMLKIGEDSEAFSEALKEESEFHSTLYHMVKDSASLEAMEKVRQSDCQFIDSVCHMLLSIRVLSFS